MAQIITLNGIQSGGKKGTQILSKNGIEEGELTVITISDVEGLTAALEDKMARSIYDADWESDLSPAVDNAELLEGADLAYVLDRANHTGTQGQWTIEMNTNKLLGRSAVGIGAVQEITLGSNLAFDGTTLLVTGLVPTSEPIIGGTFTKITYNTYGLVTNGENAGLEDITGLTEAISDIVNSITLKMSISDYDPEGYGDTVENAKHLEGADLEYVLARDNHVGLLAQSNVVNLVSDLANRVIKNPVIVGGTGTKITADTKGLVTLIQNAGLEDITGLTEAISDIVNSITLKMSISDYDPEGYGDTVENAKNLEGASLEYVLARDNHVGLLAQSNVVNLVSDLANKVNKNPVIVGGIGTKLTVDTKGLVTLIQNAGIDDITGLTEAISDIVNSITLKMSISDYDPEGYGDTVENSMHLEGADLLWVTDRANHGGTQAISSIVMNTAKLLGRTTAGTGAVQEITLGTNLSFSGTTLNAATGGAGYTTEEAQDAVGAMVDSSLVYVDATPLLTRAALTGDVTASQGSNATTIAADAVTNTKLANMAAGTFKGRNNIGIAGDPEDLTVVQAKSMLSYVMGDIPGLTVALDARGDMFQSMYDIVGNSGAVDLARNSELLEERDSAYHLSRTNHAGTQGISTITMNTNKLLGRSTGSAGAVEEITIGTNLTLSSGTLNATGGGGGITTEDAQDAIGTILVDSSTIDFTYNDATPSITAIVIDASITLAKMANMATSSLIYRKTAGTGAPEVNTLATLKTDLLLTGTNSGDQTSIVGITGTKAQFNTAVTDGDIVYVGDNIVFPTTAVGATTGVIYKGSSRFLHNFYGATTTGANLFLGLGAGNFTMGGTGEEGSYNVALGDAALASLTTGKHNVALGVLAAYGMTTGLANFALGTFSLQACTAGFYNLCIGVGSLYSLTVGWGNLAMGYQAGYTTTTGVQNTLLGYQVNASSATASNELNICNTLYGAGMYGTGKIGIGISSANITARLHLPANASGAGLATLKFDLTSATLLATKEVGALEPVLDALYYTQSTGTLRKEICLREATRVTTQFDKTNTTLADVTALTVNVAAGKTYRIYACLDVDAIASNGHKYAIGGTCTATSMRATVSSEDLTAKTKKITSRLTALATGVGEASGTVYQTHIEGYITVNAAGTLTIQFARNADNTAGNTSVLVGSTFIVENLL